jgi:type I restriction enzyme S subunit
VTMLVAEEYKMTEIGPLPPEWEVVRLGDVARVTSGGSAPQGKEFFGGQNPFIRVQHLEFESNTIKRWDLITDEAVNKYGLRLYSKGTIVFPKSGASIYLEKRAILPIESYIVSHLCAVISQSSLADQNFLFYYLRFTRLSEQKAEGYPTLNLTELKERKTARPPLPEQKKIAYVLSTVQTAIEKTEAVIKALRELKKSLMKHLFTYGPVSSKEVEDVPLKETEIGLVPEDWEVVRLGEVVKEKITDGVHKTPNYVELAIPFVTAKDIIDNKIVFNSCRNITQHEHRNLTRRVKPERGDILFTKVGTVGNVALVDTDLEFSIFVQVALIKPNSDKLSSRFLRFALLSEGVQAEILRKAAQSTMKFIGTQKIADILIPIPALSIQYRIADFLAVIEQKIEAEESKKNTLEELFKTLLINLMTGKIRVDSLEAQV